MPMARRNIMRFSSSLSRGGRPAGMGHEGVWLGPTPAFAGSDLPPGLMGLMSMGGPMAVLVRGCVGVVVVSIFLLMLLLCSACFAGFSSFLLSVLGSRGDDSVGSSSC